MPADRERAVEAAKDWCLDRAPDYIDGEGEITTDAFVRGIISAYESALPAPHGDVVERPVEAGRMGEFPRRSRMDQFSPAEKAIWDAAQAVEAMPADVRLTNAVVLLGRAREYVADFVDGVTPAPIERAALLELWAQERPMTREEAARRLAAKMADLVGFAGGDAWVQYAKTIEGLLLDLTDPPSPRAVGKGDEPVANTAQSSAAPAGRSGEGPSPQPTWDDEDAALANACACTPAPWTVETLAEAFMQNTGVSLLAGDSRLTPETAHKLASIAVRGRP